jgi:hypothetical protein
MNYSFSISYILDFSRGKFGKKEFFYHRGHRAEEEEKKDGIEKKAEGVRGRSFNAEARRAQRRKTRGCDDGA